MQKADTLLMFSGGLDSTGAFWRLAKEGRKLHVYHMNLKNTEKRARAETAAVNKITTYMRNIGEFAYTESTHIYPTYNKNFIWDSDIVSFLSGTICSSLPWIKYVAIGMTASDSNTSLNERIVRGNKIFDAFETKATKIYPVSDLTKQQVYDMLPEELRKLTWSCRTPVYNQDMVKPCGKCQTCIEISKLK